MLYFFAAIFITGVFVEIALNIIKRSPAWLPAISHNRLVKYFQSQAVTVRPGKVVILTGKG